MWEEFGEWTSKIKTHCTNLTELLYEQKQERGKYKRKKTDPVSHQRSMEGVSLTFL